LIDSGTVQTGLIHTNHRSYFSNSVEVLKFCAEGQIPWLGLKFRGPRKTVGPTDQCVQLIVLLLLAFRCVCVSADDWICVVG